MADIILILWYIVMIVQNFMAYGTAYRLTKLNGDNGVSLFGWMLLLGLAAVIPGLGIFLWYKYKDADYTRNQPERTSYYDEQRRGD